MNDKPRMLPLKTAAKEFGLSYYAIRQLALSGKIPTIRIGRGKILANADGLAEYLRTATLTYDEPTAIGGIRVLK